MLKVNSIFTKLSFPFTVTCFLKHKRKFVETEELFHNRIIMAELPMTICSTQCQTISTICAIFIWSLVAVWYEKFLHSIHPFGMFQPLSADRHH